MCMQLYCRHTFPITMMLRVTFRSDFRQMALRLQIAMKYKLDLSHGRGPCFPRNLCWAIPDWSTSTRWTICRGGHTGPYQCQHSRCSTGTSRVTCEGYRRREQLCSDTVFIPDSPLGHISHKQQIPAACIPSATSATPPPSLPSFLFLPLPICRLISLQTKARAPKARLSSPE